MLVINCAKKFFKRSYDYTKNNLDWWTAPDSVRDFYYDEIYKTKTVSTPIAIRILSVLNQSMNSNDNFKYNVPNIGKNIFIKKCIQDKSLDLLDYVNGDNLRLDTVTAFLNTTMDYSAYENINTSGTGYDYIFVRDSIQLINDIMDLYAGLAKNDVTFRGFNLLNHMYKTAFEQEHQSTNLDFDARLRAFAIRIAMNKPEENRNNNITDIHKLLPKSVAFLYNMETVNRKITNYVMKSENKN